jgi:hypothetical protein
MRIRAGRTIDREERQALAEMSERLRLALRPVQPSAAFVQSLRSELVAQLRTQPKAQNTARRTALVAAAAVGSLISVASVVGAVVYLVSRHRAQVRPVQA